MQGDILKGYSGIMNFYDAVDILQAGFHLLESCKYTHQGSKFYEKQTHASAVYICLHVLELNSM